MKIVRSFLSSLVYFGLCWLGNGKPGCRILCYHRVNDTEKDYVSVPLSKFQEQMKFLRDHGYSTVGLSDAGAGLPRPLNDQSQQGAETAPPQLSAKPIAITFDDGFHDNYENAFPIMKEYGFSGTIFLIAEKIGTEGYLSKEQILEMAEAGFEFGSHTMTHPELPTLQFEEKRAEVCESKQWLERKLGIPIRYFCYPKGLYDDEVLDLVRIARYRGACSNRPGFNKSEQNGKSFSPYLLKRTEIAQHDTIEDFKKKLAGAYDWMHRALHVIRGRA